MHYAKVAGNFIEVISKCDRINSLQSKVFIFFNFSKILLRIRMTIRLSTDLKLELVIVHLY